MKDTENTPSVKTTRLHGWHQAQGANMASFGGYDMPLWYKQGVRAEHLAVLSTAGMFDTSHMAVVLVHGADSRDLLQHCFTKDLNQCVGLKRTPLEDGRCVYGVFLNEDGTVIDDAIVYQLDPARYMVVVNAGMGAAVARHLVARRDNRNAEIEDWSDRVGKMDLQGPLAARILNTLLENGRELLSGLVYFGFRGGFGPFSTQTTVTLTTGHEILLSRTGYTGELGFELFCGIDQLESLWLAIMEAGREHGVLACGLAARDSLRTGAVLPLSHQDIGHWPFCNNPWPFALPLDQDGVSLTKDFYGSEAIRRCLQDAGHAQFTSPFAGFDPRKIPTGENSFVYDTDGNRCGRVLSCTTDMALAREGEEIVSMATRPGLVAKGLCCGFVLLDKEKKSGDRVVLSDGKRKIEVEIRSDIRPGRTARMKMKDAL